MKFVDIEELLKKYPNRYLAIVAASKEVRKLIEARKPAPLPREELQTTAETAVPASVLSGTLEPNVPKKRGRKPKNLKLTNVDAEKILVHTESQEKPAPSRLGLTIKGRGVSVDKTEKNLYIEALKKILK